MKALPVFAATALLVSFSAPIAAQTNDPGINRRQERQERRIEQGVENGSLTPKETALLEREQKRVSEIEERLKSDGKLTPRERTRLQRELNRSNRHIHRLKHNRRTQ